MYVDDNRFDEIKQFLQGRYIAASEAVWRIFKFSMQGHSPTVYRLAVHLPDEHPITFDPDNVNSAANRPPENIAHTNQIIEELNRERAETLSNGPNGINAPNGLGAPNGLDEPIDTETQAQIRDLLNKNSRTTLMAWFKLNQEDEFARNLLYRDKPKYYVFQKKTRIWTRRNIDSLKTVGRIYTVHAKEKERFALRMLLNHVRGPQSFDELKQFQNETYTTFQSAAVARGLLENSQEAIECLNEAKHLLSSASQFRIFFCQYILNCSPDLQIIWEQFKDDLAEDILYNQRLVQNNQSLEFYEDIYNLALIKIKEILQNDGSDLHLHPDLPQLNTRQINQLNQRYNNQVIFNQINREAAQSIYDNNLPLLNRQQLTAFEQIMFNTSPLNPTPSKNI